MHVSSLWWLSPTNPPPLASFSLSCLWQCLETATVQTVEAEAAVEAAHQRMVKFQAVLQQRQEMRLATLDRQVRPR